MDPVVHFETALREPRPHRHASTSSAFGWQLQMLGAEMGNYVVATTSEMDGCMPDDAAR